jgi:hypothetical protein
VHPPDFPREIAENPQSACNQFVLGSFILSPGDAIPMFVSLAHFDLGGNIMGDLRQQQKPEGISTNPVAAETQSNPRESEQKPVTTPNNAEESEQLSIPKSTGPRTARGKNRSRNNALKHGLFCKTALLEGESPAEYRRLLKGFHDCFQPQGTAEILCVERLVHAHWRLRRLDRSEVAEISTQVELVRKALTTPGSAYKSHLWKKLYGEEQPVAKEISIRVVEDSSPEGGDRVRRNGHTPENANLGGSTGERIDRQNERQAKQKEPLNPADQRLIEYRASAAMIPDLETPDRIARYEAHLSREIDRLLNRLERLQRMRRGQPLPPQLDVGIA